MVMLRGTRYGPAGSLGILFKRPPQPVLLRTPIPVHSLVRSSTINPTLARAPSNVSNEGEDRRSDAPAMQAENNRHILIEVWGGKS